jgi:hypothetical protein
MGIARFAKAKLVPLSQLAMQDKCSKGYLLLTNGAINAPELLQGSKT